MKKHLLKLSICFFATTLAFFSLFFNPMIKQKAEKEYKILLMLSSFKRPIFLSGQISRLLNQTYKNHDISVSIKGSDNTYGFRSTFLREFDQFEKTGRVSIRFDKNKEQLSNLLDTVRNVNLEKYDFYCKIDDDDWYAADYVENVNLEFNRLQDKTNPYSSSSYHDAFVLTENIEKTELVKNYFGLTGPTLCFSREVIKAALAIEKDHSLIQKYIPTESAAAFNRHEDRLLDHMARYNGEQIIRQTTYPLVIYGWQYRSVMRNDKYVK